MLHSPVSRRRFSMMSALVLALATPWCSAAPAQAGANWPTKPITWLVGYPPGGSVDVASRLVAKRLEEKLGQPVVVDNRPGASGTIALQAAAKASPDGYTIVTVPGPVLMSMPVPLLGKELTGVAQLAKGPMVLVGASATAVPTLKDLVVAMKQHPDAYSYASSGNGTSQHLAGELFNQLAHTKMMHVPYKGGSQAVTDVIGGQIPLGMLGIPPVLAHVKAGKLKAYAVTTATRSAALPDVPTMQEAGIQGFEASQWFVVAAPAGVPVDRLQRLNAAISDVLRHHEVTAGYAGMGVVPSPATPQETNTFVIEEQKRWKDLAQKANLTLD